MYPKMRQFEITPTNDVVPMLWDMNNCFVSRTGTIEKKVSCDRFSAFIIVEPQESFERGKNAHNLGFSLLNG